MKTFKQFLEDVDPLDELESRLFFKHEVNLPDAEVEEALDWFYSADPVGFPFRTDAYDHIIDWSWALGFDSYQHDQHGVGQTRMNMLYFVSQKMLEFGK
jgi:hypothetical protein